MSTDKSPAPAFRITFACPVTPFAINEEAFGRWCAEIDPDDADCLLPHRNNESPSSDLYRLITEAEEAGALTSDPRLELQVFGDEDADGSGFWVSVANRAPGHGTVALSAGWAQLHYTEQGTDFPTAARTQIEHVISQANSVLPQA